MVLHSCLGCGAGSVNISSFSFFSLTDTYVPCSGLGAGIPVGWSSSSHWFIAFVSSFSLADTYVQMIELVYLLLVSFFSFVDIYVHILELVGWSS